MSEWRLTTRQVPEIIGAGEGNRTLVFSLEGCCSTIELHPRYRLPNTAGRRSQLPKTWLSGGFPALRTGLVRPPLNSGGLPAYIEVFRNQRKEVIQCLLPSAVTSLGSPARLSLRPGNGALSALDQRVQRLGRGGSNPAAPFLNWVSLRLPCTALPRTAAASRSPTPRGFSAPDPISGTAC